MNIVESRPGLTQHDLAAAAEIDASTLVATLDGLEQRGLAERRIQPEDRRKRAIHLTPAGEAALDAAAHSRGSSATSCSARSTPTSADSSRCCCASSPASDAQAQAIVTDLRTTTLPLIRIFTVQVPSIGSGPKGPPANV